MGIVIFFFFHIMPFFPIFLRVGANFLTEMTQQNFKIPKYTTEQSSETFKIEQIKKGKNSDTDQYPPKWVIFKSFLKSTIAIAIKLFFVY